MAALRILVDLLEKAEEVWEERRREYELQQIVAPSTLVHCSAGITRTAVFLGLYRLWLAYREAVFFDPRATVAAMREQRGRMVERQELYTYMLQCLRYNTFN